MKLYLVGGAVRDKLLGKPSKDLDYAVVLDEADKWTLEDGFGMMKEYLLMQGFHIFLETPKALTIRAKFPNSNDTGDFVLARRETGKYFPDTRIPICVPGSLFDDLIRRDFTINSMAKDIETGELIDLFGGEKHIQERWLTTPVDPMITFCDDPLRILRALRFSVQLNFNIDPKVMEAIWDNRDKLAEETVEKVSDDRIRQEFHKAFKADTYRTIEALSDFPKTLVIEWFPKGLWLMPTFKE